MPAETARLMRMATYASISVALMLIVAKLVAWGLSDSLSLLATLYPAWRATRIAPAEVLRYE